MRLPVPNLPLCRWLSQLFDLRAPSSTDFPVLLLKQPTDLSHALSGSRFYTSYLASLKQRGRLGGGLCQIALWNYFLEGGEF